MNPTPPEFVTIDGYLYVRAAVGREHNLICPPAKVDTSDLGLESALNLLRKQVQEASTGSAEWEDSFEWDEARGWACNEHDVKGCVICRQETKKGWHYTAQKDGWFCNWHQQSNCFTCGPRP